MRLQYMPIIRRLSILLLIIVTTFLFTKCDIFEVKTPEKSYTNPIKFCLLIPLGNGKAWAESISYATVLAEEEINASGGLLFDDVRHDIKIVIKDTLGNGIEGVNKAQEFFSEGGRIIIGPAYSGTTLGDDGIYDSNNIDGVSDFAIANKMIMMSYSATNPAITGLVDSDMVWRTVPSDLLQGQIGADYLDSLGKSTASIIWRDDSWGQGVRDAFIANYDGTIDDNVSFPSSFDDESNFSSYVDQLFNPDVEEVVYIAAFSTEGSKLINDIVTENGSNNYYNNSTKPLFFSNDGIKNNHLLINGDPEVIIGMEGTNPGSDPGETNYAAFLSNYSTRFGFSPDSFAEYAYDAVYVIAYALQKSQVLPNSDLNMATISSNIAAMTSVGTVINVDNFSAGRTAIGTDGSGDIDYNGASGSIAFDGDGDPTIANYVIWRINDDLEFEDVAYAK